MSGNTTGAATQPSSESYISYLRKKVDGIEVDDGEGGKRKVTPLIETKRGIGYMIREPKN